LAIHYAAGLLHFPGLASGLGHPFCPQEKKKKKKKKTTTSAQIKFLKLHRNALGYSFLNSCKLIITPCSIYWYQSYIDSQYGSARKPMAPSFRGSAKFCIEHQRAHFGLQLRRTPVANAYQQ
jgi:hypothetical protein